jgi:hypothetical protein
MPRNQHDAFTFPSGLRSGIDTSLNFMCSAITLSSHSYATSKCTSAASTKPSPVKPIRIIMPNVRLSAGDIIFPKHALTLLTNSSRKHDLTPHASYHISTCALSNGCTISFSSTASNPARPHAAPTLTTPSHAPSIYLPPSRTSHSPWGESKPPTPFGEVEFRWFTV